MCESGFGVKGGDRNPRKAPFFLSLRAEFESKWVSVCVCLRVHAMEINRLNSFSWEGEMVCVYVERSVSYQLYYMCPVLL